MRPSAETPACRLLVGEDKIAYRDLGAGTPIVLLQRFRGAIDDWDPHFVDRLAARRRVILFDAPGVGGSTGSPSAAVSAMAADAAAFVGALGLGPVDVLGWSMGGLVAQALAILHPRIVRRVVLAATCPPGNPRLATAPASWVQVAMKPHYDLDDIVALFFTASETSRAAAAAAQARIAARVDRVPEVGPDAIGVQLKAQMQFWRNEEGLFARLSEIAHPVLIGAGDHDLSFPAINQVVLLESLPAATLAVYPDSGHGFHMQNTAAFCAAIDAFLDA